MRIRILSAARIRALSMAQIKNFDQIDFSAPITPTTSGKELPPVRLPLVLRKFQKLGTTLDAFILDSGNAKYNYEPSKFYFAIQSPMQFQYKFDVIVNYETIKFSQLRFSSVVLDLQCRKDLQNITFDSFKKLFGPYSPDTFEYVISFLKDLGPLSKGKEAILRS